MGLDTGGKIGDLNVREFFAAMALSGLLAKDGWVDLDGARQAMNHAYTLADMMIEKGHQDWKGAINQKGSR
jgi:hypothetical protein